MQSRHPEPVVQAAVLSGDPLISYSGTSGTPLGLASHLPSVMRDRKAWFLVSPTWSIETEASARSIRKNAVLHRMRNPDHFLIFLCNTQAEVDILHRYGEAAFLHNKTSVASERLFRPLGGSQARFDAVYNAQLAPWKRHELTLDIKRCAFIFYRDETGATGRQIEQSLMERHRRLAPGHIFLNSIDGSGRPVRMKPEDVNRHLNDAAVGLCLSAVEGPMFASTEYMLAGLPVVTTPNRGGRDVYMDDEYCLTVPPDPRSVSEAVGALKARGILRNYIHERTLARLESDRRRFVDLLNAVLEESGSTRRIGMPWPFRHPVMEWLKPEVAIERALAGNVDAFVNSKETLRQ